MLRDTRQLLENNAIVSKYLDRSDWRVKENSNMNFSLQGMNFHISSIVTSQYWLSQIYTPQMKEAQESGDFHMHDLGILAVYCVGWDLQDLIREGFKGTRGKVASKPAKHFRTILGQIVNSFIPCRVKLPGRRPFQLRYPASAFLSTMTTSAMNRSSRACRSLFSMSMCLPGWASRPRLPILPWT